MGVCPSQRLWFHTRQGGDRLCFRRQRYNTRIYRHLSAHELYVVCFVGINVRPLLLEHRYKCWTYRIAEGRTEYNAHGHTHCNVAHGFADCGPKCYPKPYSKP